MSGARAIGLRPDRSPTGTNPVAVPCVWRIVGAVLCWCWLTGSAAIAEVLGSGSTLCYPIMTQWIAAYERDAAAHIVYQPIGSSAGITEIRHAVVDFAVTEAPLDDAQLLRDGLAQFPLVMGAVVPVVNVEGIAPGQLHLSGPLLADIYLGKVMKWNDPAIAALNQQVKLPDLRIQVVHRSDGSGTSFVWTDYLAKVSVEWKARVGENTTVAWPTGYGGKGNGGVADIVARVRGAVGYVDYGYTRQRKLAYALVRNQAGNFVVPEAASFQAATEGVDWLSKRDFAFSLTDAPAPDAWPIMATSFALIRAYPGDAGRARDTLSFLRWALENGRDLAAAREYLPLPPSLVRQVKTYLAAVGH